VSIPDPRKGEALVLLTDYGDADLSILPEAFRAHGLTELAIPRKKIILAKLPLLGTGKTDYVAARALAINELSVRPADAHN
jgi:acyl-[acyl-carrier-protein]-phospholipid O-acyltransferase/long-chain-fatty-acid--[acyl-carrier-protein] ligase